MTVLVAEHPVLGKTARFVDMRPPMAQQGDQPQPAPLDEEKRSEVEKADVPPPKRPIYSTGPRREVPGPNNPSWDHDEAIASTITGALMDELAAAGMKTEPMRGYLANTNLYEEGRTTTRGIVTGNNVDGFYIPGGWYGDVRSPAGQVFGQQYHDLIIFSSSTAEQLRNGFVRTPQGGLSAGAKTAVHEAGHQLLVREEILDKSKHNGNEPGHQLLFDYQKLVSKIVQYQSDPEANEGLVNGIAAIISNMEGTEAQLAESDVLSALFAVVGIQRGDACVPTLVAESAPREVVEDACSNTTTLRILPPEGEGQVSPDPGEYEYEPGEGPDLSATPAERWEFSHWEGLQGEPWAEGATINGLPDLGGLEIEVRPVFVQVEDERGGGEDETDGCASLLQEVQDVLSCYENVMAVRSSVAEAVTTIDSLLTQKVKLVERRVECPDSDCPDPPFPGPTPPDVREQWPDNLEAAVSGLEDFDSGALTALDGAQSEWGDRLEEIESTLEVCVDEDEELSEDVDLKQLNDDVDRIVEEMVTTVPQVMSQYEDLESEHDLQSIPDGLTDSMASYQELLVSLVEKSCDTDVPGCCSCDVNPVPFQDQIQPNIDALSEALEEMQSGKESLCNSTKRCGEFC